MGCQHLLLCSVWPVWNGGGMLGKLAMSAHLHSRILNIRNSMFKLGIFPYLFETKVHSYFEVRYNDQLKRFNVVNHTPFVVVQGSVHTDLLAIPVTAKNRYSTFSTTNAITKISVWTDPESQKMWDFCRDAKFLKFWVQFTCIRYLAEHVRDCTSCTCLQ